MDERSRGYEWGDWVSKVADTMQDSASLQAIADHLLCITLFETKIAAQQSSIWRQIPSFLLGVSGSRCCLANVARARRLVQGATRLCESLEDDLRVLMPFIRTHPHL